MPHSSFAFTIQNVDRLFEHVTLRVGSSAGRNLAEISAVGGFGAFQINDCAARAQTSPRFQLRSAHVRYEIASEYRQSFLFDPLFVRSLFAERLGAKSFCVFRGV